MPAHKLGKCSVAILSLGFLTLAVSGLSQEPVRMPVTVTIRDDKPVVVEPTLPIDPRQHVQIGIQGNMMLGIQVDNNTMHLGVIQTVFHIDGQVVIPGNFPSRMLIQNKRVPKKPGKRDGNGILSVCEMKKVQITQIVEVAATKPSKGNNKRRLDALMVRYLVDNKDKQAHKVGVRVWMDMFLVDNDGALFAAPNKPGQILDGIELKDKDVPDYLQVLQRPNLNDPGYVAHFTYNFGKSIEKPNRVVLTSLGGAFGNGWDMRVFQAMGDSAIGFYWDPKEVSAGKTRRLAYGYGKGICPNPEGDGQFAVVLGGSFEPGKLFSVAAVVQEPANGQTLILELPPGMQRVEGRERQPVPVVEEGHSMVLWKARVQRTGEFALRVHSSSGVTQTKIITISR